MVTRAGVIFHFSGSSGSLDRYTFAPERFSLPSLLAIAKKLSARPRSCSALTTPPNQQQVVKREEDNGGDLKGRKRRDLNEVQIDGHSAIQRKKREDET